MSEYQQRVRAEYGDIVTVNKYRSSDTIYIDFETDEHVDVRFVRLTVKQGEQLVAALNDALSKIEEEQAA